MSVTKIIITSIFALTLFGLNIAYANNNAVGDRNPSELTNRPGFVNTTWKNVSCTGLGNGLDTDGDGICDAWEDQSQFLGLNIDFTKSGKRYQYQWACGQGAGMDPNCPSPTKRDVYLELDWMHDGINNSHVPLLGVVSDVKAAFAAAPDPDGGGPIEAGITLHVQNGEYPASTTTAVQGDTMWHTNQLFTNWSSDGTAAHVGFYRLKQYTFGTVADRWANDPANTPLEGSTFDQRVNPNFSSDAVVTKLTAKFNVFHYGLIIYQRAEDTNSLGWAEIWGNDHVWSLGSAPTPMGNLEQQKAVFMHEFGHNFKLDHGGQWSGSAQATPNKPNYFSVMNPVFQFMYPDGKDLCRPLDYSGKGMNALTENTGLNEANGVSSSDGLGYLYPSTECFKSWPSPGAGNAANASLPGSGSVNVANTQRFFWYQPVNGGLSAFDRVESCTGCAGANWDNDVNLMEAGVSDDVNADGSTSASALTSNNDWTNLTFDFGGSAFSSNPQADDEDTDPLNEECLEVPPIHDFTLEDSFTTGCRELTSDDIIESRLQAVDEVINQIINSDEESSKTGVSDTALEDSLRLVKDKITNNDQVGIIEELLRIKKSGIGDNVKGSLYNLLDGFEQSYLMGTKVKSGECEDGDKQIVSFRNGYFACVKSETLSELEERGWGFELERNKNDLKSADH